MNFVLVHGGWHGGWCWKFVDTLLRAMGHNVVCPTMTGLGERSRLLSAVEGPQTHVEDICNVIRWNELEDVILVGHSYGGMIVTGVASLMPEKIKSMVYVDGFVPTKNQTPASSMSTPERAAEMKAAMQRDGTILPNGFERWSSNSETIAWLKQMCTPHPAICFCKGVKLSGAEALVAKKVFVLAKQHQPSPFLAILRTLQR